MKLQNIEIHKYKSIENTQNFELDPDVTILVGMNESGKTAILETIAKTNYFEPDEKFEFSKTHDYPRREKKKIDKSGIDPAAITCTYKCEDDLINEIEEDLGKQVIDDFTFKITTKYSGNNTWRIGHINHGNFIKYQTEKLGIYSKALADKLKEIQSVEEIDSVISQYKDENIVDGLNELKKYFKNEWNWDSGPIWEYISRTYIKPNLPKFLYYDEYYSLPSRISIEELQQNNIEEEELKTAKALFELADINIDDLINSDDFEDYKAELEATQAIISDELFNYWSTNRNLDIEFDLDKVEDTDDQNNKRIVEHILDVRVKNYRSRVSLPLKNRSKGFNWFFSFLVWFKKIQEDSDSEYILLLDEPGLNLHAAAQKDLLDFIEDLTSNYQIVYTTHSPFMIPDGGLDRVRTVLETQEGSVISDSVKEKDPDTLFPLQAALGYDIAQNLFISKNNLLVEGVSDLIYLQTISSILEESGREHLLKEVTVVPTGGLQKVATFISLLRGNNLNTVCFLDTFKNSSGKAKMNTLIKNKLIDSKKILFADKFLDDHKQADIEDLFDKQDYLKIFNGAFSEKDDISLDDLNSDIKPIIIQINQFLNVDRFNHYRPANYLAKQGADNSYFNDGTLDKFEEVFKELNSHFDK
ncbi:AAA family ATPase [Fodinibius saliphilus]|uniref:AAA family ATPase n=1 Tax=Fodinibius saliphilus TaxID=1920650 RepID=UPI001109EE07|nr:AAA family ATPase [Fodinibius saliphilus]